jgi:hypothetical protein
MQADEIAEAVLKLKSDGKLMILDCLILPHKQNYRPRPKFHSIKFNFRTHFEPMLDGSFDYMQIHGIVPVMESLGSVFREIFRN